MTIINNLLEWFGQQKKAQTDTVLFEILFFAPDYELTKSGSLIDQLPNFSDYLNADLDFSKQFGKLLFSINAIDFSVAYYDDVDKFIETQNFQRHLIESGEKKGRDMDYVKQMLANSSQNFEDRKDFKNAWITFRNAELNFGILDEVLKQDFINRK